MAVPIERGSTVRGFSPRILNVILGAWLFISAFAWPHSLAQRTNTWILGALCVLIAFVAMAVPRTRYVNTILAIWLFISAWALTAESIGTIWNNAIVAIAVFIFSLISSQPMTRSSSFVGHNVPPSPA